MTGLAPGDQFAHINRSDPDFPLVEWLVVLDPDVTVAKDRTLTDEQMERYGVRSGLGNRAVTVSIRGRGAWPQRHGVLARTLRWDRSVERGQGGLRLFTSGHDCEPLDDFIDAWHRRCPDPTRDAARQAERASVPEVYLAVAAPRPDVRTYRSRTASTVGLLDVRGLDLLHPGHLTRPDHVDGDPGRWIGEPHDNHLTLADSDGNLWNIATWHVVPDIGGVTLRSLHTFNEEEETERVRRRLRDALKAVARSVDANEGSVSVRLDTVTIPHAVLEALVLGDERGVASVLDGVAELADTLTDVRASRAS